MARLSSSKIMMGFGILAGAGFFLLYSFIASFLSAPLLQQENTATRASVNATPLASDPLVTVVPPEITGGVPHILPNDPRRGKTNAAVTIIEFGDYQCEACAAMHSIMQQVMEEYGDRVEYVWKDFPIPALHAQSAIAGQAAYCAGSQGAFWEYHDMLLNNQGLFPVNPWHDFAAALGLDANAFVQCLESAAAVKQVTQGYYIARALGLDTTPTYYINNEQLTGAQTLETLRQKIEEALQPLQQAPSQ